MIVIGILTGVYVTIEWLKGITHVPLTVLTALLIISGVQFFIFGLFGDLLVTLQREEIEALQGKDKRR